MLDHGNGQLSAVGFFNPWIGEGPVGEFFGSAPAAGDLGPFRITPSETEPAPAGSGGFDIGEGYVQVGGFTIEVEGKKDFPTASHEIVAVDVVIDAYGHPSGRLVEFSDFAALQEEQDDLGHVYIPIYKFSWGDPRDAQGGPTLVMDLRRMPMTGPLETFLDLEYGESGGGGEA